ncbi:hypothetical protein Tco_1210226 [Tanacetum coccineum]
MFSFGERMVEVWDDGGGGCESICSIYEKAYILEFIFKPKYESTIVNAATQTYSLWALKKVPRNRMTKDRCKVVCRSKRVSSVSLEREAFGLFWYSSGSKGVKIGGRDDEEETDIGRLCHDHFEVVEFVLGQENA